MDINSLLDEWEIDSNIDKTEIGSEALRMGRLHSKYIRKLSHVKQAINKLELVRDEVYRERMEYYRGIGEEVYEIKIIKTDLPMYLKADEKLNAFRKKLDELYLLKETLIFIVGAIKDAQFQIKSYIEWNKFMAGEG